MSVVGVSPGSPEALAPRSIQPTARYNPSTGVPVVEAAGAADGSQPVTGANGTSAVSTTNPLPNRVYGSPSFAATQVDVTTGQVGVIAGRTTRAYTVLQNLGTVPVYFGTGSPTVSSTNSFMLPGVVGATITIYTTSAIIATAASTQRIAVLEVYG